MDIFKILGMIKHNFVDRSKETISALYKNLVRPYLEYSVSYTHLTLPTKRIV